MIVMLTPFPPFLGGASLVSHAIVLKLRDSGFEIIKLNTMQTVITSEHKRSVLLYVFRMMVFLRNVGYLIFQYIRNKKYLVYHAPDAGNGMWFTYLYVRILTGLGKKIVFHHHSYKYVTWKSELMLKICKICEQNSTHIFLDPEMHEKFIQLYGNRIQGITLSNLSTSDILVSDSPPFDSKNKITIGYLSNLSDDKGFDVIERVFTRLHYSHREQIRFKIAGSPVDAVAQKRLDQLKERLGADLEYYGTITGDSKLAFYRSTDIFVFPTRFDQEAQPRVIYEALASGSLVVASKWAGIPWQLQGTVSKLVELNADTDDGFYQGIVDYMESENLKELRWDQARICREKMNDAMVELDGFVRKIASL